MIQFNILIFVIIDIYTKLLYNIDIKDLILYEYFI